MIEDKIAIVSSQTEVVGFAVAKRFLQSGATVIFAEPECASEQPLRSTLTSYERLIPITCNRRKKLDVHNLVMRAMGEYGQIDILVNVLSSAPYGDFFSYEDTDYESHVCQGVSDVFKLSRAVVDIRKTADKSDRNQLSIVNVAPIQRRLADPSGGHRFLANLQIAALRHLTRELAIALVPEDVRVNGILPGHVREEEPENAISETDEDGQNGINLTADPAEIADTALFLASPLSSFVTGETLRALGGALTTRNVE